MNGELSIVHAFICELTIAGVMRAGVGQGRDPKTASSDALKRAAAQFGVGADVKAIPFLWVPVDGDGKWAKPVKDPRQVYLERLAREGSGVGDRGSGSAPAAGSSSGGKGKLF